MSEEKPRSYEVSIEIDAPPSEVWKAIASAEGITKWFAPEAKVTPGKGGTVFVSWGPGMEGTSNIEVWEENQHLCVTTYRSQPYGCAPGAPSAEPEPQPLRIAVDYFLESEGGKTVLRLVHSGFGTSAGWDAEIESTKRGWPTFFRVMKHGIEYHPNDPAKPVTLSIPSPHHSTEAWKRFETAITVDNGRYTLRSPEETVHGKSLLYGERHFAGAVEEWNNALVSIVCESYPGATDSVLYFMLTLYGPAIEKAEAIGARWNKALTALVA
ncbi:MAG: SRPBCC domain-containing protein [Acidobacteria bacterium]|nr:SRPBCC domain-containing protein [Acidobacteriota bacterium]